MDEKHRLQLFVYNIIMHVPMEVINKALKYSFRSDISTNHMDKIVMAKADSVSSQIMNGIPLVDDEDINLEYSFKFNEDRYE